MDVTGPDNAAHSIPASGRRFADTNGVRLAYEMRGNGPPLLLVMGYRLSAIAWPDDFLDQLARFFTVIAFDNRGTGESDKPVHGYAIDNLARDAAALLDQLGIARAHLLGYSMGGAVVQAFVRQFPDRVDRLVLCATMCGGPRAIYCDASVQRVMRNLAGLTPDEAARKIWTVTYAPDYLARHSDAAEVQMQRETTLPTPLHAADLQFQAFAGFDSSDALPSFRCPTLVLTGDLDVLVPPRNSDVLSSLIPDARKIVVAGRGHRVMWEDATECASAIVDFLQGRDHGSVEAPEASTAFLPLHWTKLFVDSASDLVRTFSHSTVRALGIPYGDGKPVIIVPGLFGPAPMVSPLVDWLRALGYRPSLAGDLAQDIVQRTDRTSRKAVIVTFDDVPSDTTAAMRDRVSDIIVVGVAPDVAPSDGPRIRSLGLQFNPVSAFIELTRILASIPIELLDQD